MLVDAEVLPEGAAGVWTPTVERLWVRELKGVDVTVNAGAILVDGQGYDNVMVEISGEGARILYRERMPVPISMWQPWLTLIGESGGARAVGEEFLAASPLPARTETEGRYEKDSRPVYRVAGVVCKM